VLPPTQPDNKIASSRDISIKLVILLIIIPHS
jgi:hypothetical protein